MGIAWAHTGTKYRVFRFNTTRYTLGLGFCFLRLFLMSEKELINK